MMDKPVKRLLKGRFAHTVFCDDIRQEANGKGLFIGVYSTEMFVPSLPITLPTFGVLVTVSTPVDMPLQKVIVRLLYGEDVVAEAALPEQELEAIFGAPPKESSDPEPGAFRVFRSTIGMNLTPFVIEKEGVLKVRVETESEILPGGALSIRVANQVAAIGS